MAYSKQNFQNGQILNAANLETMENGIIAGQGAYNLLDNSDFRIKNNIINTKGLTDYSLDSGDVFDRWRLHWTGDGRVSIKDGYIELYRKTYSAYLFQHPKDLESMIGKTYTVAAKVRYNGYIGWIDSTQRVNSGSLALNDWDIATCTFTVGSATSDIGKAGIEIATKADLSFEVQWVALYEGAYTKDTLPDYVPKSIQQEMMDCGIPLYPKNLLKNSDFTNPSNVNRGMTSYSGAFYDIIDLWDCATPNGSTTTTELTSNGLKFTHSDGSSMIYLRQNVSDFWKNNKAYTTGIYKDDGTFSYSGYYNSGDGKINIVIPSGTTVASVVCYEGKYTEDMLPPYVPKGKHVEMLNCNVPLAPHNLLDNSDFRNPVNQRGQTSYTGSAFTVDRWRTWNDSATITLTSDGIKGGGTDATVLYQGIELHKIKLGTAYTVAIGYSDSTISCATGTLTASSGVGIWNDEIQAFLLWNDGSPFMRLWHATKTIQWAAIYPGSYDASTLPAYQPKGYAAELAECRRYYVHCGEGNWMTGFYKIGEGLVVEIPAANNIRATYPTIIVNSPKVFTTNGWYDITYASCSVTKCWTKLLFNRPEEANQYLTNGGAHIITGIVGVSADL